MFASALLMQSSVLAQELDRDTVAAALKAAEESRASYHVLFEQYAVGKRPPPGQRGTYDRLTDGTGRGRRTYVAPVSDEYGNMSIAVWSPAQSLTLKKSTVNPSLPQLLTFNNKPSAGEHVDQFEMALGRRFGQSSQSPSEVVSDKQQNVMVRYAAGEEPGLVEVVFVAPRFSPHSVITHVYDPGRQWGLVEWRMVYALDDVTGEDIPADRQATYGRHEMTDWRQSNGVWVPTRVHNSGTFHPGTPEEETLEDITEVQQIEMNPAISDTDFEVPTDHLPKDSMIVDGALGISYKLGENRLYMDGRLHKLNQPVCGLISAGDLPAIMQDAIALIAPETPPLQPVASTTSSWRVGGYSFLAGGVVLLGAVFWMRRRGAGS